MDFKRIVIEHAPGRGGYHVVVDGEWIADGLASDECLGCVASAIYGPGPAPQFTKKIPVLTEAGLDLYRRERMVRDGV
jgi:hypothetical protein